MGAYSVLTFTVLALLVLLLWREKVKADASAAETFSVPAVLMPEPEERVSTLYWMEGSF